MTRQSSRDGVLAKPVSKIPRDPSEVAANPLRWDSTIPDDFDDWSYEEKVDFGARLHLIERWTVSAAAKLLGLKDHRIDSYLKKKDPQKSGLTMREVILRDKDLLAKDALSLVMAGASIREGSEAQWNGWIRQKRRVGMPWEFITHYFGHVRCPDCGVPHPMPDVHTELLKTWHHPDTKRQVTLFPPYHAKTTVWSIWDTIYDICRDPDSRTIVISKTNPFATSIMLAIKTWLTDRDLYSPGKNLIDDYGPFRPAETGFWSADRIYCLGRTTAAPDPTVLALGVGQQISGRRAEFVKCDDIATIENSINPELVRKTLEYIDKDVLSRVGKAGKVGFVGTRQRPGDIYRTLIRRLGYRVVLHPAIISEERQETLWPDHFDYQAAITRRAEMDPVEWELVYQQNEVPEGAMPFDPDHLERAKDATRMTGVWDSRWVLIAGLDLAGSRSTSGYTCAVLLGLDRDSGQRHLIDMWRAKGAMPEELRQMMVHWSSHYKIAEWKVETNSLQESLVQMNDSINRPLAAMGTRITGHQTGRNKWDKSFGVESMVPLFSTDPPLISIPWNTQRDRITWLPLLDELASFPLGPTSDTVMALWFAEVAARDWQRRSQMPLYSSRRVPEWVAQRRHVISMTEGRSHRVSMEMQRRLAYMGKPITREDLIREEQRFGPRELSSMPGVDPEEL